MKTPSSKPLTEDFNSFAKVFSSNEPLFLSTPQAHDVSIASTGFPSAWKALESVFESSVSDGDLFVRAKLEAVDTRDGDPGERDSWITPGYGATDDGISAVFSLTLDYPTAFTLLIAGCAYNQGFLRSRPSKITLGSLVAFWLNESGVLLEEFANLLKGKLSFGVLKDCRYQAVYALEKSTLFIRFDAET